MTRNPPPLPEVLLRSPDADCADPRVVPASQAMADAQTQLPLATEGVLRYVWESRFGPMLIEAAHGEVFVNGERVVPFAPPLSPPPSPPDPRP